MELASTKAQASQSEAPSTLKNPRNALTEHDIPRLRAQWLENNKDIMSGVPDREPPLREINHTIPLIDEAKVYLYHSPRCADALKPKLHAKIQLYEKRGWWKFQPVRQAAPMLTLQKKNGDIRTVVDLRKRNDNTVKDVTPLPDQDQIRMDVARAPFRSKIDLSDAYEQVRVVPEDVGKTAFSTVYGTMVSIVMQQGDCNAPSTFQRIMVYIFRDHLGKFVHVYLDDIFVFSNSIEEHEEHLRQVFAVLRKAEFFLKAEKCDLYSARLDCLGHIIDHKGLHADADKMARIRDWRTPRELGDVQRFLGLVQYLAHFMPDVSAYSGPLAAITKNGHAFEWRPLHQRCFEMIKHLAYKSPILRPIDPSKDDPIWVICDASIHGVGALYGQGPDWETCRPAGLMSRKFTTAQHAYRVFELETLAILEALLKWEDKLLGFPIRVVSDHKALEFFKTQSKLSPRQTRWMEFLSRFNYTILYVQGSSNKVADCLSRYYANDREDEHHNYDEYVQADVRLDPEGEELPLDRLAELRSARMTSAQEKGLILSKEASSARTKEAQELREHQEDPQVLDIPPGLEPLPAKLKLVQNLDKAIREGYPQDTTLSKVFTHPEEHHAFKERDGLLWTTNRMGQEVLCIPRAKVGKRTIVDVIIDNAHQTLGHFGARKTSEYVRRWFWWPTLGKDILKFCLSCGLCQTTKPSNQAPMGLLHSLPIPTRPWQSISMDFLGPFPRSQEFDYLWVILCRLTSHTHLIPIVTTIKASELAWLYVREIVRLHGVAESIVSDRDTKFTSAFWKEVHRLLGTRLLMSTAFHPQTDGATERANRSIIQILRATVKPDQADWVEKLPMVEFALNSAASASTGFAPFELTGGFLPRMTKEIPPSSLPGVQHFAEQARDNLLMAHDAILDSRVHQTHHANKRRRDEQMVHSESQPIKEGDLLYLSTADLNLPRGRARKLVPKYIGPYKVLKAYPGTSNYKLELPDDLAKRGIHPMFHISRLRRHEANDSSLFPHRDVQVYYDLGTPEETEWLVDEIVDHEWSGRTIRFHVKWNLGDLTWEPLSNCAELEALDNYLDTQGVRRVEDLPRRSSQKAGRMIPPSSRI